MRETIRLATLKALAWVMIGVGKAINWVAVVGKHDAHGHH